MDEGSWCRTGDLVGRAAIAGGYHDQQLHDGVVDGGTARLDNEDIFLADAREDADAGLALRFGQSVSLRCQVRASLVRAALSVVLRGGARARTGTGTGQRRTLENWLSSASAGSMPRFSHICLVRAGHELPAKIRVLRILWVGVGGKTKVRRVGGSFCSRHYLFSPLCSLHGSPASLGAGCSCLCRDLSGPRPGRGLLRPYHSRAVS